MLLKLWFLIQSSTLAMNGEPKENYQLEDQSLVNFLSEAREMIFPLLTSWEWSALECSCKKMRFFIHSFKQEKDFKKK